MVFKKSVVRDNHHCVNIPGVEDIFMWSWFRYQPFNPYIAELFLYKPWIPNGYYQFEIIINVLVSSF